MAKKAFYESKTLWLNLVVIIVSLIVYALYPDEVLIALVVLSLANFILRFATNKSIGFR